MVLAHNLSVLKVKEDGQLFFSESGIQNFHLDAKLLRKR